MSTCMPPCSAMVIMDNKPLNILKISFIRVAMVIVSLHGIKTIVQKVSKIITEPTGNTEALMNFS